MRAPLLVTMLLAAAACGPKAPSAPVLALPGDGADNTAKPPTPQDPATIDPWAGRTDLITAPASKPPVAVLLPPIEEFKLKNGLTVFAIKSDRLPVLSFQVAVKAGRRQEPRARLGVAELTADMLVRGTKQHDGAAFAKAIETVGGTIATDATYEATVISCSVLARDAATCLQLVPEMLMTPAFPAATFGPVRDQMLGRVRARISDPSGLAAAHVQSLLWGPEHVRGWVATESAIAAIRREDLIGWHKTWFSPGNTMLVVSGDFDPAKLKKDLERAFGGWRATPVPPTPKYAEPGLSGSRIRLVDKPGQTQTFVRIAQYGIAHDDPAFFDSMVWNYALGTGPTSRLAKATGVATGQSFGAVSSFDRNADRGSFVAQTVVRSPQAVGAAKTLLAELATMAQQGPTQEEITAAVSNLAGGYGLRFQSAADIGAALIGAELHGFGKEYLANYAVQLGMVEVESAKRAAATVLTPSAYVMVLVGDAKDLEPQLRKAGWRYQKVGFTESLGPVAEVPPTPVVVDPKSAAAAKTLVEAAILAKGGRAKLAAVKSFRMLATGTTTINAQTVPVEIERLFVVPDKMRIDATLAASVKVIVAVNGNKGWQLAPDQTGQSMQLTEVGGPDMASVDFERWREPELILLRATDPSAALHSGPDEMLNNKAQNVIKLRAPQGNVEVTLYLDKATKLITRMAYREGSQDEADDFTDYKAIDGIMIAHTRHSTGGGRETKLALKEVAFNPTWDPKLFDQPAAPSGAAVPPPAN